MNAATLFHRAVVVISGQPDSWATPMNETPGHVNVDTGEAWKLWGRSGSGCNGGECNQGRAPEHCDCELACDIAPDAARVIQPPAPLSDDMRARLRRRALYLSALLFGVLAGLLSIADARWEP